MYQWHKVSDLIDMAEDASDLMFPEDISEVRQYVDGAGNMYASREEYDAALYQDIVEIGGAILAANDSTKYAGPPPAKPSIWQRIKRMIGL